MGRKQGGNARAPSLLAGLIYDANGERMTPTHANKNGRRYRYYVTHSLIKRGRPKASETARRIPAREIERIVEDRLLALFENQHELHEILASDGDRASEIEERLSSAAALAKRWPILNATQKRRWLLAVIGSVTVKAGCVEIEIRPKAMDFGLTMGVGADDIPVAILPDEPTKTLTVAALLTRTGIEKKLLIDNPAQISPQNTAANLHRLVARAYDLQRHFLAGGKPIAELAKEAGITPSYYTRLVRLSFLAPDITRAILRGRQPADLTATKLMADTRLPLDWRDQRRSLRCG